MSPLTILLILFCLSLHACNARPLRFFDCKGKVQSNNLLTQGVDGANYLAKVSNPLELQKQGHQEIENNGGEVDGLDTMQQNFMEDEEDIEGYKIIIISPHNDLQKDRDKVKGLPIKRQARSMLGNDSGDDTEEAVDSKENDAVEDIVVMDYAQPHRKPPIHNEKH